MRIRANAGTTLLIDSVEPVKLTPNSIPGAEYGIGIHCGVESDALLVIAPDAHVPHRDAYTGLWTRYDLSPLASLVSVQLSDLKNQVAGPPNVGGRYTSRTRVHTTDKGLDSQRGALDSVDVVDYPRARHMDELCADGATEAGTLSYINESCNRPSVSSCGLFFASQPSWTCDWTFGRRFKGLAMGTPTTNVIATVVMAGPRAASVIERMHRLEDSPKEEHPAGLLGQVHLAVQDVNLRRGGQLVVARIASEHREDMHRMLHHALCPLEGQLGIEPYSRRILASSTASRAHPAPSFIGAEMGSVPIGLRSAAVFDRQT